MSFGETLELFLKELNIKQADLNKAANLDKNAIGNWKRNGNFPKGDVLYRIASYMGITMESFITGKITYPLLTPSEKEIALIKKYRQADQRTQNGIDMLLEINNAPSIVDDMVETIRKNSDVPTKAN